MQLRRKILLLLSVFVLMLVPLLAHVYQGEVHATALEEQAAAQGVWAYDQDFHPEVKIEMSDSSRGNTKTAY